MAPICYVPFDPLVFSPRQEEARGELAAFCTRLTLTDHSGQREEQLGPPAPGLHPPDRFEARYWQTAQALLHGFEVYRRFKAPAQPAAHWPALCLKLSAPLVKDSAEPAGQTLSSGYLPDSTDPRAAPPRRLITLQYYAADLRGERLYGSSSAVEVLHEQGHALLDLIKPSLAANKYEGAYTHEAFADSWALLVSLLEPGVAERLAGPEQPFAASSEISRLLATHARHQWQLCTRLNPRPDAALECLRGYASGVEPGQDGQPRHFGLRDACNGQRWDTTRDSSDRYKHAQLFLALLYSMLGQLAGARPSPEAIRQAAQQALRILLEAMRRLSFAEKPYGWIGCAASALLDAAEQLTGEPQRQELAALCRARGVGTAPTRQEPVRHGPLRNFERIARLEPKARERWAGILDTRGEELASRRAPAEEPPAFRTASHPKADGSVVEVWSTLRAVDVSAVHPGLRGVRLMVPSEARVHLLPDLLHAIPVRPKVLRGVDGGVVDGGDGDGDDNGWRGMLRDQARFEVDTAGAERADDAEAERYVRSLLLSGELRLPGEPLPGTATSPATHELRDVDGQKTIVRVGWT